MRDYLKLFTIIVFAVLLSITGLVSSTNLELRFDENSHDSELHPLFVRHVKMRCTRRFSPGVCVENVASVWTFMFLQQNCTERLGCPNNFRSNRFRSYRMCMKRCRGLVDVYLKLVELDERMGDTNDTLHHINETDDRNLRGGYAKLLPGPAITTPTDLVDPSQEEDEEEEEYKVADEDTSFVEYKDNSIPEDIRPVDVDDVHGEIRSEVMMEW